MNTSVEAIYGLTSLQEGMLLQRITNSNDTSYHIQNSFFMNSECDRDKINMVLELLIRKHEVLRTAFVLPKSTGTPRQVILKDRKIEVIYKAEVFEKEEECIRQIKENDLERGFDLQKDSLFRVTIVSFGKKRNWILFSFHHIIMDGWCLALVFEDFFKYYGALSEGKTIQTIEKEIVQEKLNQCSYKEYIEWLNGLDKQKGMQYWKKLLKDFESQSEIKPINKPIPVKAQMDFISKKLSLDITKNLLNLATRLQVTINVIAESAWGILLQKMNYSTDVVFGKVVSGRNVPLTGIHSKVGLFINTIPVRILFDSEITIEELLKQIYEQDLESSNYEFCGLADIQSLSPLGSQLFNTIIVFENYADNNNLSSEIVNKYKIEIDEGREQTNYPVSVRFSIVDNALEFVVLYNPNEFTKEDITAISERLGIIFETIAYQSDIKVSKVDMITEKEYDIICNKFNDTDYEYDRKKTIVDLFEEQVKKTPNNIALVHNKETLTYEAMNRKVNIVANKLRNKGIKRNDFVGIIAKQNMETIICIYGIIKAGAAYLPIDVNYPKNRINYILEDAKPQILLVDEDNENYNVQYFNIMKKEFWEGIEENPTKINKIDDLAYCIYTSGTTGLPKGVLVCHQGIPNLRNHFVNTIGVTEKDIILQFASIVFDASVWEMTMALLTGAKLVIPTQDERINNEKFLELVIREKISIATLPPIFFNNVSEFRPRILITAGSESSREIISKVSDYSSYINAYGPTEFTVCATQWKYAKECELSAKIPIGKPICNTKVLILNGTNMCGIGVPGELCMSGIGIAKGYLKKENLTEEKFIDNPFGQGKLYRSGDLARWLPDGNIEYLGRIDQQVKIRGFRIELSEVESVISRYHNIKDAVVIAKPDQTGENSLFAYFVSSLQIDIKELKQHLKDNLPDYMVPNYLMQIKEIPTTINGKLDKKNLPDIIRKKKISYIAPRNDIEKKLCQGYETILNIEKVGIEDDFYELGGNSIKAMKLVTYLKKYDFRISISNVLRNSSVRCLYENFFEKKEIVSSNDYEIVVKKILNISELIRYIEEFNRELCDAVTAQNVEKKYPISAMQKYSLKNNILHSGTVIGFDYKIDPTKLGRVLQELINTEGAFRSILVSTEEEISLVEYSKIDICKMVVADVSNQTEQMQSSVHQIFLEKIYGCKTWKKENILNQLLYQIAIIKYAEDNWKIYIPFCHLLFDGMSADIIQSKIVSLYHNGLDMDKSQPNFYEYVQMISKGPDNISCDECINTFDLTRFNENIERQSKHFVNEYENIIIKLDVGESLNVANPNELWNLAYKLYNKLVCFNLNMEQVSSAILISNRRIKKKDFHNNIGQFLDLLPITDNKNANLDYDKIESLLLLIRNHQISFSEFMYGSAIADKYQDIKKIFNKIALGKLQIPVFNYVGFFQDIIDEKQLFIDKKKLSLIVDVYCTDTKIILKAFCKKDRLDDLVIELKEELKRNIGARI